MKFDINSRVSACQLEFRLLLENVTNFMIADYIFSAAQLQVVVNVIQVLLLILVHGFNGIEPHNNFAFLIGPMEKL